MTEIDIFHSSIEWRFYHLQFLIAFDFLGRYALVGFKTRLLQPLLSTLSTEQRR